MRFSNTLAVTIFVGILPLTTGAGMAGASEPADKGKGPQAVLRFRGGPSFEHNNQNTGPAWLGGASAGVLIAGQATVMLGIDRISLDHSRAATPLTLQIELSKPFQRTITPSFVGGLGAYIVEIVHTTNDLDFLLGGPPGPRQTEAMLGWYLGAGLSFRISSSTMFDLGLRHQQATGHYDYLSLDTIDTGFTFRL
jgi:opacity protein-like surface antigen